MSCQAGLHALQCGRLQRTTTMTACPTPMTPEPLRIVCPSAVRPMAIVLACAGLAVLATAATKLFGGDPERFSWFKVWVLVLMGTAFTALLYRNLFVRDVLLLYRHMPEGRVEESEGEQLVLAASSVRSVRVCPPPGAYSAEGKNAALGIGTGLIEIEATEASYRFGAGLDQDASHTAATKIAAYCGLREVGPQWQR